MTNLASQKQLYSLSREGASQLWKSWEKITILNFFPNKLWKSETESDQGCKYVKTIGLLGLTKDTIPNRPFFGEVFSIYMCFELKIFQTWNWHPHQCYSNPQWKYTLPIIWKPHCMTQNPSENVSLFSPMFPWRLRLLALSILAGLYLMVRMVMVMVMVRVRVRGLCERVTLSQRHLFGNSHGTQFIFRRWAITNWR